MVDARLTCIARDNHEWLAKHTERIEALVKEHLPSGAGFDHGTSLDLDASTGEKLVFNTAFHHMNDGGFYDGWTEHHVICTPSLAHDFSLKISGRNRNDIKEHIHEVFSIALQSESEF